MEMTLPHQATGLSIHVEVRMKPEFIDSRAKRLIKAIREFLKLEIDDLKIIRVYAIHKKSYSQSLQSLSCGILHDPVLETAVLGSTPFSADWTVEIGFKPGVTDNAGKTAQLTLEDFWREPFCEGESVQTSTKYLFMGNLSRQEITLIANELLANPLIERISIHPKHSSKEISPVWSQQMQPEVEIIPIQIVDEELQSLSETRQLALNLSEMQAIRRYFSDDAVSEERNAFGLPSDPTDVELEALAQTWSEHCKHKIFNANIQYIEDGKTESIHSLFKTYIKKATEELSGRIDWLASVFTDNAGLIRINDQYLLGFKVETHNSPSALDPYGGALTGVLGVNRDIMGAGRGARLLANTNVLCFAPPCYQKKIPEKLMHPKRIMEGVCRGIEHGGNKSGIPTVNGSLIFDERYLGKPLVYCGSIGIMPAKINGVPSEEKEILPGDLIIIAGGRTGKDGIHGATFSSEVLNEQSSTTSVQIGDPFTQKKLSDFLIEARDQGLYRTLTDNGAGGFSSSIGELAILSGGCEIELDKALLKQSGLAPWEILLSESQERMTLAVSPEHIKPLSELAGIHEVELVQLGIFTDSGLFHALYNKKTVALLSLEFLHEGVPTLSLQAEWETKAYTPLKIPHEEDYGQDLHRLLSRYNICSKESIVRQYDHEVQGGTVLKPFAGAGNDGPSDAAILCPYELMPSKEGIVVGHGICPRYSDYDTYHMAACAIDEAIRNCVAVGADPAKIALLDNFCWPDPIYDPRKTADGKLKLAQLVRANKALYFYAKGFEAPIISGKDSMKNDYKMGNIKISVPPTLLISAIGTMKNIEKAVSMDVKCPGDHVYLLGMTMNELGGSEYACMKEIAGGIPPVVCVESAKKLYHSLHRAMLLNLVASCHDCSDGGLAVSLAEISFAGHLGLDVWLNPIGCDGSLSDAELLFSESASRFVVTVDPLHAKDFEACFFGCPCYCIGKVREDGNFYIDGFKGNRIIQTEITSLKEAWQSPLGALL